MSFISIKIDSREQLPVQPSFSFQMESLPLGDVCFLYDSHECILIERKSYKDFVASLKDGRWENQRIRYYQWKEENPNERQVFYYFYEPSPYEKKQDPSMFKAFESAKTHLAFRDRFHIIVGNESQWIPWLEHCYQYMVKHTHDIYTIRAFLQKEDEYQGELQTQLAKTQNGLLHKKRNASITPESCYLSQLCCIPQISIQTAKEIQKQYPTMNQLYTYFALLSEEEAISELQKIPGIGKTLAPKILTFLLPTSPSPPSSIVEESSDPIHLPPIVTPEPITPLPKKNSASASAPIPIKSSSSKFKNHFSTVKKVQ